MDAILQFVIDEILFSVDPKHHPENQKPEQEIDGDTTQHDNQSLPCRLGTEFPGLRGLFHLFEVHAFIHHPGDLDITSQWQPSYSVFGFTDLLFEKCKLDIKKQVKFFDFGFKPFSRQEVAELMQYN